MTGRGRLRRWIFELGLGARMSVAGGRAGWARLTLIAAGTGVGVALLLCLAALPAALEASGDRESARTEAVDSEREVPRGDGTMLIGIATTTFHDDAIHGRMLQPEGSRPPVPPGVTALPKPGEMLVSPALRRLIEDNPVLGRRWEARIVGTIGDDGLTGPADLAFYLGTDTLTEDTGRRIEAFGHSYTEEGVSPVMLLLTAVGMVVLLTPVMVFMASAVRFGGEARDKRLAALRLVGSDAGMTRRIAAGETLAGAVLGLLVGTVLAAGAALLAHRYATGPLSFYLSDMRPVPVLAALIALGVPAVAVLVTLSAMRRVVVEPLGVVRLSTTVRRRLWWRLILPVAGIALLWPLTNGLGEGPGSGATEFQAAAGVALLLIGLALLLPWLVDAVVHRLGGGGVAWELAVRRLQLDSGTAVRAVSGIAVSVAGVIAVQGLVSAIETQVTGSGGTPAAVARQQVLPQTDLPVGTWTTALRETPGVQTVETVRIARAGRDGSEVTVRIGSCAALEGYAALPGCTDGDAFAVNVATTGVFTVEGGGQWTAPASTRDVVPTDSLLDYGPLLLLTPAAAADAFPAGEARYTLTLDGRTPNALEQLRNTAARMDPQALVYGAGNDAVASALRTIRQGLLAGTIAMLVLIGASMVVNVAEQMRERRRVLAVLVAFGTRRRTMSGSVLLQAAVPVLLGMTLAIGFGSGLAAILMAAVQAPVTVDWFGIGTTSGMAALVVLGTTAAALPTLLRLTRPGNLRSE
ncbi:ABC transporter permease [Actinoplanes xinjiangensis]|uniref:FtsX-like permease family protein n=1 Tax=Actinoplanes xinjiangensis TaxID=512350 RepID=A0A316FFF3_9ACTN|nr:ABC transporter permease [Actinoplanes xinjiangensis]PWK47638.1 FtsX-like permease family protein [Actinoplanes xinjiangensis]GIF39432.1 membrane protein [Actinoplanes xinjiangensis]